MTHSKGNATQHECDTLNFLTGLATPQVSVYTCALGAIGSLTSALEQSNRFAQWNYDGIYGLTNETISADPARVNGTAAYSLDPVGNRQSETSTIGGLDPGTFSYNVSFRQGCVTTFSSAC